MILTEDLKDTLKELINISFGSATASIADLFDSFATLHIPKIEIIDVEMIERKISGYYGEDSVNLVTQNFNGEFSGEILFVATSKDSLEIKNIVFDEPNSTDYSTEDIQESLLEIANILGVTCIGKLGEMLETELMFLPPRINFENRSEIISYINKEYSNIIFVDTILEFKKLSIQTNLFILVTEKSFVWLESSLNEFLEEY